jgi:hypothetical protein
MELELMPDLIEGVSRNIGSIHGMKSYKLFIKTYVASGRLIVQNKNIIVFRNSIALISASWLQHYFTNICLT